jgi:general secretion pathway protein G
VNKYFSKKLAFSLMELIFIIVVMGIIASVALPKLMETKTSAVVSAIKQDISTVTTSVLSYYLVNGKIDKISDAVTLNSSTWDIEDLEIRYVEDTNICVSIKVESKKLIVSIDNTAGKVCKILSESGVVSTNYDL